MFLHLKKKQNKTFSVNRDKRTSYYADPFLNGEQAILYINKVAIQNT